MPEHGANRPAKITISNRSRPRLQEIKTIHREFKTNIPVEYVHTPSPEDNNAVIDQLVSSSVVVNATGMGKDVPGSPITDAAIFPQDGIAWDFNYRGDLVFLDQARARQKARNLRIEDSWIYFIHGWTRVMAKVFNIDIPVKGQVFDELSQIASKFRK